MTFLDKNNNNLVRENLVKTAVRFLQNPKVSASPLEKKQEFLRKKGLTDEEIRKACELSTTDYNQNIIHGTNNHTTISIPDKQDLTYYHLCQPYQLSLYQKVKEIFHTTALISTTIYCVYWFYKKFIKPFIYGYDKKIDVTESMSELGKSIKSSMKEVKDSIQKVNQDVQKLSHNQIPDPTISQLVQELKQDLSSLKSLLLSRKQFPSAPASIPSWQLDSTNSSQEKTAEHEDDAGSGSSANNSDSSLEMIREDPPKFDLRSNAVNPT